MPKDYQTMRKASGIKEEYKGKQIEQTDLTKQTSLQRTVVFMAVPERMLELSKDNFWRRYGDHLCPGREQRGP